MFRAIILPIFRSTRLCYSLWYNAPTMLPARGPKHVELTGIINKPLLLHLVGCLYYLYFIIYFFKPAKQSQFIPLQNVVYFITLAFLVRKIFTYLLTPWCRVLLEKLAGLQLVKKFPAFYGTRRFITVFKIFTFYINDVLLFKSPFPGPKG